VLSEQKLQQQAVMRSKQEWVQSIKRPKSMGVGNNSIRVKFTEEIIPIDHSLQ